MAIQIRCPECDSALRVPEEMVGKKVRCKKCQEVFVAKEPGRSRKQDEVDDERLQTRPRLQPRSEEPIDAPRPSRKKRELPIEEPASSGSSALPLILGGVAALFVILGSVIGGIWFFSSSPVVPANAIADPMFVGPEGEVGGMPPGMGGPQLRYRFQGAPLVYSVNVEVDHDTHVEHHQGSCVLRAEKLAQPNHRFPQFERQGSGTGFVVDPSGILITCHHVIANTTKIEVVLGGKTYPGRVLTSDDVNDLAIVQIEARDLPCLTLGDSDAAEVGQEIRALGYPLSSVLGDNIKATRGTIAGINKRGGRRSFQIDAAINPGNSGGPLVAENGRVLGVNNSKLAGDAVSNVGFAAPSNEVKRLLQSKGLRYVTTGWDVKLDGPTLVRRVAAATALLKVTVGPDLDADSYRVTCSGSLFKRDRPKPGHVILPGPPRFPRFPQPSVIEIDASGNVSQLKGGTQLPLLLGEMGMFAIEPLARDGSNTWETSGTCTIEESSGNGFGAFGPRFPRAPFGPPGMRPNDSKVVQAKERSRYVRGEAIGHEIPITKRYELKADPIGGSSGYHLVGESQIRFDTAGGFFRSIEFKGMLTRTSGNASVKLPVHVSYKLLEGEERAKILNPPAPPPPPPSKPVTEADLPGLLADAKQKKRGAIDKLAAAKPIDAQRTEVVKTLIDLTGDDNAFVKRSAVKALGTWGEKDKESGEILVKMVDDSDVFTRQAAIEALTKLQDDRGIEPIAKRLTDGFTRRQAGQALRAYGSKAEKAVVGVLENAGKDWVAKIEACNVLKDVGTRDSLPALEKAAREDRGLVNRSAKEAIDAISKRK